LPKLAVIGFPVGHSRSPAMQNAALAELGLREDWEYDAVEAAPEDFEQRVRELAAGGYAGLNVTVPHKEAALGLADEASEAAGEIGAANTLSFHPGAETGVPVIAAENTDAAGFLASLPSSPRGKRALVLGAGGAARAVVWALAREGAQVAVWNRTAARAEAIAAELGGTAVAAPSAAAYELIVNTSAAGLHGDDPFEQLPLVPDSFEPEQVVVDMVYGDRPSLLLAAASARDATTVDGLEILVQQGALSLEIWTGRKAPLGAMRAAARG
jgi:shikimate dehydrogenase